MDRSCVAIFVLPFGTLVSFFMLNKHANKCAYGMMRHQAIARMCYSYYAERAQILGRRMIST